MQGGAGKREQFNMMIGNISTLQDWNTELHGYTLDVPQPFYYCKNTVLAIPLYLCSMSTITHKYTLLMNVNEILRMRIFDDKQQQWLEVKCNYKYLEGLNATGTLENPELWGRYALVPDYEKNWRKEEMDNKVYIEDIIMSSSENTRIYGETVQIDLDCDTPCKAIFWVSENMDASNNRNFSNF